MYVRLKCQNSSYVHVKVWRLMLKDNQIVIASYRFHRNERLCFECTSGYNLFIDSGLGLGLNLDPLHKGIISLVASLGQQFCQVSMPCFAMHININHICIYLSLNATWCAVEPDRQRCTTSETLGDAVAAAGDASAYQLQQPQLLPPNGKALPTSELRRHPSLQLLRRRRVPVRIHIRLLEHRIRGSTTERRSSDRNHDYCRSDDDTVTSADGDTCMPWRQGVPVAAAAVAADRLAAASAAKAERRRILSSSIAPTLHRRFRCRQAPKTAGNERRQKEKSAGRVR